MEENDFAANEHLNIIEDSQQYESQRDNANIIYPNTTTIVDFSHENEPLNLNHQQQQTLIDKNKGEENFDNNLNQFDIDANLLENSRHTSLEIIEGIETDYNNKNIENKNPLEIYESMSSNNLPFNNSNIGVENNSLINLEPEFNTNQYLQPEINDEIIFDKNSNENQNIPFFSTNETSNNKFDLDKVTNQTNFDLNSLNENKLNKLFLNKTTVVPSLTLQENELEDEDKFDEGKYSPSSESGLFFNLIIILLNKFK